MSSRKQFEQYVANLNSKNDQMFQRDLHMNGDGEYSSFRTENMWKVWQAARESLAANLPHELEFDLRGDEIVNSASNSYASGYNDALREVDKLLTQYD